jgi:hypothetical protein
MPSLICQQPVTCKVKGLVPALSLVTLVHISDCLVYSLQASTTRVSQTAMSPNHLESCYNKCEKKGAPVQKGDLPRVGDGQDQDQLFDEWRRILVKGYESNEE